MNVLSETNAGLHIECANREANECIDLTEDHVALERPTCEALNQHHRQTRARDQNQTDQHANENRRETQQR